jgi:hypothetical protein
LRKLTRAGIIEHIRSSRLAIATLRNVQLKHT